VTRLRAGLPDELGSNSDTDKIFSLLHSVSTGSETHRTGGSFPRVKLSGFEAEHLGLDSNFRIRGGIPPFLRRSSWRVA
jgi:hypothetical protein